jgi:hypothetical protein
MKSPMADQPDDGILARRQVEARRVAAATYPFRCCAICGLEMPTCLTVAHLDQNGANIDPDNLAYLCATHHWMCDAGLYPVAAIKLLRDHWQTTKGLPSHASKTEGFRGARALRRNRQATAGGITVYRETPT